MSLKDLWRPGWTAGSRQCQDCGRCRTRGRDQGSTSAMPRHWLRQVCGSPSSCTSRRHRGSCRRGSSCGIMYGLARLQFIQEAAEYILTNSVGRKARCHSSNFPMNTSNDCARHTTSVIRPESRLVRRLHGASASWKSVHMSTKWPLPSMIRKVWTGMWNRWSKKLSSPVVWRRLWTKVLKKTSPATLSPKRWKR